MMNIKSEETTSRQENASSIFPTVISPSSKYGKINFCPATDYAENLSPVNDFGGSPSATPNLLSPNQTEENYAFTSRPQSIMCSTVKAINSVNPTDVRNSVQKLQEEEEDDILNSSESVQDYSMVSMGKPKEIDTLS